MQHANDKIISTGADARKTAGYPEALKEIMLFMSWEMGVVISTRVGNPPRIDIPVLESTKASDIKTKTAPSSKAKDDLFLTSPARGTIIVDQEIFGKTGSGKIPDGQGYGHVPYPTTLRDLLKYVEEGKLDKKIVGDEIHFEALGDFKPVANGYYKDDKLKFTKSDFPPSLTYSIKLTDLNQKVIKDIFAVSLTDAEKKKLSPWVNNYELSQESKTFLQNNAINSSVLDKPIPLYYRHDKMPEFKILEVVAKDNAIVIGDDDTLSMSPSIAFLDFIKKQNGNNPKAVHELMDTMGNFNSNPEETARRLFTIEKLLCEFNIQRLSAFPNRIKEVEVWNEKLKELMKIENPEKFYMDKYYKNGKFSGIDSCGNDGMSAFELIISLQVNEKFHSEVKHIGQFIQHPPELRNHTVPSDLEKEKMLHIWNGQFILTHDENGMIAFYSQYNNSGKSYAEKFPLLAEQFVEVSPVWLTREYKNENHEVLSVGADKWWPMIAIQIALGQEDLMDRATLQAYNAYINNKPELRQLDNAGRAERAEKKLLDKANISELSDLLNPNLKPSARSSTSLPSLKSQSANEKSPEAGLLKKLFLSRSSNDSNKQTPHTDKKPSKDNSAGSRFRKS